MTARILTLLFCWLLIGLTGCGEPLPEHEEAIEYARHRADELGVGDRFGNLEVFYYRDQRCIPAPYDPEHKETCRRGRAWAFGPAGCWIEVVLRGYSCADTSLVHEIWHCRYWKLLGDSDHSEPGWAYVPVVNDELREMGL